MTDSSINVNLGLGAGVGGGTVGYLMIYAQTPSTNLAQPTGLQVNYPVTVGLNIITNATNGVIEQVKSPQGLVAVSNLSSYEYELNFIDGTNVTGYTNGLYTFTGTPVSTWVIQNPDGAASSNRLWVTEEVAGSTNRAYQYTYTNNAGWNLLQPDGLTTVSNYLITSSGVTNEYWDTWYEGQLVGRNETTYTYNAATSNSVITQVSTGTGSNTNITVYTYYSSNATNGASTNLLRGIYYPNGEWNYYIYDDEGRLATNYSAYSNNPTPGTNTIPNPATIGCKITSYIYDGLAGDSSINPWSPRCTIVQVPTGSGTNWTLQEAARTYNIYNYEEDVQYGNNLLALQTQVCTSPGASEYDANSVCTLTLSYVLDIHEMSTNQYMGATNMFRYGRVRSVSNPDQTVSIYDYGTNSNGDTYITNCTGAVGGSGYWDYPGGIENVIDGVETVTVQDAFGRTLSQSSSDILTGLPLTSQTYTYLDPSLSGKDYQVVDMARRTNTYLYGCCALDSSTDPDGVETVYGYDALIRPTSSTVYHGTGGIETQYTLDGNGRVIETQRIGTNGSSITLSQTAYDVLGRVTSQTNSLNGVTTTVYAPPNGAVCITNTNPDGSTRIETHYLDGTLASVTGTAVEGVAYQYGTATDVNGNTCTTSTATKLNANGTATSEWTETFTDMAGRATEVLYADGSYSQSLYNGYNQLTEQIDPDGVATLYQYDDKGALAYRATDAEQTGSIDFSGTDPITFTTNDVTTDHGTDVRRTRTYVWATNSVNSSNLVSESEVSVNGLTNWQSLCATAGGTAVTTFSVTVPGISRTETTTTPDGASTVSTYSYGMLTSIKRYDSNSVQIAGTTYMYDPQGRNSARTDARNGTTDYSYNNADQITSVTTPDPGGPGSPETTTTFYDQLMRATGTIYPDGTTTTNIYVMTGQILSTSGSRTYPVGYGYDYAGRMTTMTNWTNFGAGTGARVTTWIYDPYRGFLTNKTDAAGYSVSYTNSRAGRLAGRTWARGTNTAYAYNTAGDLASVKYNDGATPGITNTYDRLRRKISVVCGATTASFAYDLANDLLSESYSGGTLAGLLITNQYDGCLRRSSVALMNGSSTLCRATDGYDAASRLATVSDGTNSATYSYLANSSLVGQILCASNAVTRMTTSKQYDFLDRLSSIASTPSNSFAYLYNAANQRTMGWLWDSSYWRYGYDSLGQVVYGNKYWVDETPVAGQQFDYAFDTIGNRVETEGGGDQNGQNLRIAYYTNNNLNQITSRTVPAYVDVMGLGIATNPVVVNGSTAYRKNEYFRQQLSVTNTSAAVWDSITVSNTGASATGHLYVPETPESYSYDADGNLISDGRWNYTWDAENRLLSMTSLSGAPSGSQLELQFTYDFQGRRIQKQVWTNNGSSYISEYTNKYAYDGWNCLAVTTPSFGLSNTFLWGTDLSGSQRGAGGVGGLIRVSYFGANPTNCFVAYDGNGNVSALVSSGNAATLANYAYGPFGELLQASGPMAKLNPMRFSTKYDDDESDFLYYGYRYYNPSTGRWLNRDPLGQRGGGPNLYLFLSNAPPIDVDGDGQAVVTLGPNSGPRTCGGWQDNWLIDFGNQTQTTVAVTAVAQGLYVLACPNSANGMNQPLTVTWFESPNALFAPGHVVVSDKDTMPSFNTPDGSKGGYAFSIGVTKLFKASDVWATVSRWGHPVTQAFDDFSTRSVPWFWNLGMELDGATDSTMTSGWSCCCGPYYDGVYKHNP